MWSLICSRSTWSACSRSAARALEWTGWTAWTADRRFRLPKSRWRARGLHASSRPLTYAVAAWFSRFLPGRVRAPELHPRALARGGAPLWLRGIRRAAAGAGRRFTRRKAAANWWASSSRELADGQGGAANVALRPEMTPTLARMVVARERDYRKPLKWFCVPQFFRDERQQRGRLREFYQLNCDIIGEASPAADAEMIAQPHRSRCASSASTRRISWCALSDRQAWSAFAARARRGRRAAPAPARDRRQAGAHARRRRAPRSCSPSASRSRKCARSSPIRSPRRRTSRRIAGRTARARPAAITYELDLTIVRGLAYYTGVVFEVFDRERTRARPRRRRPVRQAALADERRQGEPARDRLRHGRRGARQSDRRHARRRRR